MVKATTKIIEPEPFEHECFLLASVVEHSDDAVISKTLDGIVLSWNAAAERIYGYPADTAHYLFPDMGHTDLFSRKVRKSQCHMAGPSSYHRSL